METREPTAREQFARDFLLVVENDKELFSQVHEVLIGYEEDHYQAGQELQEWFSNRYEHITSKDQILAELLNGWGGDTWASIARSLLTD